MAGHNQTVVEEFTKQAAGFAASPEMTNEEALQLLVTFTGAGSGDTVLDVACGPGLVVCAFARIVRHATGLDLVPAMIEKARSLQSSQNLANVSWQVGDVVPLQFADGSFTIVTSRYAFHHFQGPRAVLAEMKRVCAPGGRVVVCDVMASSDAVKAEAYNRMEKLRDPSHVRALSLAEMLGLFDDAGFGVPQSAFYRIEFELEYLLTGSFPHPGDADKIRNMFADFLAGEGPDLNVRRVDGQIFFSYPIVVLRGLMPSEATGAFRSR